MFMQKEQQQHLFQHGLNQQLDQPENKGLYQKITACNS